MKQIIIIFSILLFTVHCSSNGQAKKQKKLQQLKKTCLEQGGQWIEARKACKLSI